MVAIWKDVCGSNINTMAKDPNDHYFSPAITNVETEIAKATIKEHWGPKKMDIHI